MAMAAAMKIWRNRETVPRDQFTSLLIYLFSSILPLRRLIYISPANWIDLLLAWYLKWFSRACQVLLLLLATLGIIYPPDLLVAWRLVPTFWRNWERWRFSRWWKPNEVEIITRIQRTSIGPWKLICIIIGCGEGDAKDHSQHGPGCASNLRRKKIEEKIKIQNFYRPLSRVK